MHENRFGLPPGIMFGGSFLVKPIPNPIISFKAPQLDSRVKVTSPPHVFVGADGKMQLSQANQLPIEYVNGVVSGRHEPEIAATNYMPSFNYESIGAVGGQFDWLFAIGNPVTTSDSDLGFKQTVSGQYNTLTGVYSEATSAFLAAAVESPISAQWQRVQRAFNNPQAAVLRWYTARQSSTIYIYGRSVSAPTGDLVASVYRKLESNNVLSVAPQIEAGNFATSPIITAQGVSATRAASSVRVVEPLAKRAVVRYSDNTNLEIVSQTGEFNIPRASLAWRTRFITEIELLRK